MVFHNPLAGNPLAGIGGISNEGVQLPLLIRGEPAEHMTCDIPTAPGMAHADPDPDTRLAAKGINNGTNPVVPAMAPALDDFQGSKGQIHIVMHHDDVPHIDLIVGGQALDRGAAAGSYRPWV